VLREGDVRSRREPDIAISGRAGLLARTLRLVAEELRR
jgi:hypothetical protein